MAVLFDLDGVLTSTASQHFRAWKETFDDLLAGHTGTSARPFELDDYHQHVDGRSRYDGVRRFLAARGITLPEGRLDDPSSAMTVHGVGNRKNEAVRTLIESEGVERYEDSIDLARRLRNDGLRLAVVSASRNCRAVLDAAGIARLFDTVVDGTDAAELDLAGKPEPDTFLEATRRLEVRPDQAVVVEDALAGVAAGRAGGFGLVIGVDRRGQRDALLAAGADIVVASLDELD